MRRNIRNFRAISFNRNVFSFNGIVYSCDNMGYKNMLGGIKNEI